MFSCDDCKTTYVRKYLFTQHLKSRKHKTRIEKAITLHFCDDCGKSYTHKNSLEYHKKMDTCNPIATIPALLPEQTATLSEQTVLEKMQQELNETKEKMQQELNETKEELEKTNEKMKQELEKMKEELRKIKAEPAAPKSRDIRKQIKKETRTEVVIEQENKCGECKEELSLYFQIDHVVGIQFGGTNEKSNLMALCCECHTKKSIAENKCRRQIKEAIQTILRDNS